MIAQIKGIISYKGASYVVVYLSGLGYKVFTPLRTLTEVGVGKETMLWTHLHIRENIQDLYGFSTKEEIDLFEMLIGISGIGPKSALSVLNLAPIKNLIHAIGVGDPSYLTKVSGVGKKTAEKIILELRDKLGSRAEEFGISSFREDEEVVEALKTLGYASQDAREALRKINLPTGGKESGTSDKIKEALKLLSRS